MPDEVTCLSETNLTQVTFKWSQAFVHCANVDIKVGLRSRCCIAQVTCKWPQAFVHTALVVVKVLFQSKHCLADITYVWLQAFMHCTGMSQQMVFPPKRLSTPFPFTLEPTRTPISRHGSTYTRVCCVLYQAHNITTTERTGNRTFAHPGCFSRSLVLGTPGAALNALMGPTPLVVVTMPLEMSTIDARSP